MLAVPVNPPGLRYGSTTLPSGITISRRGDTEGAKCEGATVRNARSSFRERRRVRFADPPYVSRYVVPAPIAAECACPP